MLTMRAHRCCQAWCTERPLLLLLVLQRRPRLVVQLPLLFLSLSILPFCSLLGGLQGTKAPRGPSGLVGFEAL